MLFHVKRTWCVYRTLIQQGVWASSRGIVRDASGRIGKGQLTQIRLYLGGKSPEAVTSYQGECSRTITKGAANFFGEGSIISSWYTLTCFSTSIFFRGHKYVRGRTVYFL